MVGYVRDFVDARRSVGEFMLPVMLLVLALTFVAPKFPAAYTFIFAAVYGLIGLAAIDLYLMWRKLKGQLVTKFGPSQVPRGMAMYAVMRAFQMRRTRMAGEPPRVGTMDDLAVDGLVVEVVGVADRIVNRVAFPRGAIVMCFTFSFALSRSAQPRRRAPTTPSPRTMTIR